MRVGPNGKKRVERRDGVDHLAAHLFDLQVLDCPDAAPVDGIYGGAFDLITSDVGVSWSLCPLCLFHDEVLHGLKRLDEDRQLRTVSHVMHRSRPLLDARGT